jgi:hypothetical protein
MKETMPRGKEWTKIPNLREALEEMAPEGKHELPDIVRNAARRDPMYDTEALSFAQRLATRFGKSREECIKERELNYLSPRTAKCLMDELVRQELVEVALISDGIGAYEHGYGQRPHEDGRLYSLIV